MNKLNKDDIVRNSTISVGDYEDFREVINKLKEERKRLKLTLRDVAILMGVPSCSGAISLLETGKTTNPQINTLIKYARALGKQIEWKITKIK